MPKVRKLSKDEAATQSKEEQLDRQPPKQPLSRVIDQQFPNLSAWIQGGDWIEFGTNEYSTSLIRILNIGGMLWESEQEYDSLDELLQAAEDALTELEANGDI